MMLACPIIDDVNFDHLIKVVSDRILHYEITIFPLLINGYFVVELLWHYIIILLSDFQPLVPAYVDETCLK